MAPKKNPAKSAGFLSLDPALGYGAYAAPWCAARWPAILTELLLGRAAICEELPLLRAATWAFGCVTVQSLRPPSARYCSGSSLPVPSRGLKDWASAGAATVTAAKAAAKVSFEILSMINPWWVCEFTAEEILRGLRSLIARQ